MIMYVKAENMYTGLKCSNHLDYFPQFPGLENLILNSMTFRDLCAPCTTQHICQTTSHDLTKTTHTKWSTNIDKGLQTICIQKYTSGSHNKRCKSSSHCLHIRLCSLVRQRHFSLLKIFTYYMLHMYKWSNKVSHNVFVPNSSNTDRFTRLASLSHSTHS